MIDEAIRRCLRYAIGTCLGLSALVYVLDPDRMGYVATSSRPGSSGGGITMPRRGGAPSDGNPAPPAAPTKAPRKPLTIRAPSGVVLVAFAPAELGDALRAAAKEFRNLHGGSGVLLNLGDTAQHREALGGGRYADLVIGSGQDALAPLAAAGRIQTPRALGQVPLALAVPRTNPAGIHQLADLAAPGRKVAIAAPSTPVGALTRQALAKVPSELGPGILGNVVAQFEDPSQVLTRLGLGSVDAGFVLRSHLSGQFGQRLKEIPLPSEVRPTIPFQVAVLPTSERLPFAEAFQAFLESSAGRRILGSFGVEPPPSS